MNQINPIKERVADVVRELAESREMQRIDVQRALKITDRRWIETRWSGHTAYNVTELAAIGDLFGVRVADILIAAQEDDDEPGDGAMPTGAPNPAGTSD